MGLREMRWAHGTERGRAAAVGLNAVGSLKIERRALRFMGMNFHARVSACWPQSVTALFFPKWTCQVPSFIV